MVDYKEQVFITSIKANMQCSICHGDYGNSVNYDTTYSKIAHKYFLKAFYNRTNKKKYNMQSRECNVCHTNVIVMKNVIISKRALQNKRQ